MKKSIRSLAYLFLAAFLSHIAVFAHSTSGTFKFESTISSINVDEPYFTPFSVMNVAKGNEILPPGAPTVTSPIYLCQNSTAAALTATASAGATLMWYGTNAVGGAGSPIAPIPSTTAIGQTKYYVSQTDGTGESPRAEIVVNVVADNGAVLLNFKCDATQILAADKNSSVFFDWSNNPLISNNLYNYTYSVEGGAPVSGTTSVSHQQIFGMLPGQSATLTLSATTFPCVLPLTLECFVPCGTSTVTPNFAPIAPICSGSTAPILGPMSPNNISGTWFPATVSNTTTGNYVFTPNSVLFPCATTQTLTVTVTPLAAPVFVTVPSTVCQNATAPILPSSSSNVTPITGTWSPATVNTTVLGPVNYVFTPNSGQCVSSPPTTLTITVNQNVTPTFTAVPTICSGAPLSALPTTSNNGIIGTWFPSLNNTATTTYTFTPSGGQCATATTMTISVTPNGTPTFAVVSAICTGTSLPPLPTVSNNGYTGTWSPALDNTVTTTYTFTPDTGQCAIAVNLTITVNQLRTPNFASVPTSVCENSIAPILPSNSSNASPITGTWNPATVDTSVLGTADYIFTPDAGQCADTGTISITVNPSNSLVDFQWTVTEAFSENQVITITATGAGDYLYRLDDGPFQESPIFEYVSVGYHSVTVEDVTACSLSITRNNILVIGYPRFFTPNNDGYNDMWNVFTLVNKLGSKIQIFDRYGKLLKEISPNGTGWNGTYNGRPLPATDYWFVVDYPEDGIIKKFRSHFSLKR
jgi:gliding motility-associated-like protein